MINEPTSADRDSARREAGVMLPGIDPIIAEIVLAAVFANPTAHIGVIIAALIRRAPEAIATEIADACVELLLCKAKGSLYWINIDGQAMLAGIREVPATHQLIFGTDAKWPLAALMTGSPKAVTIRLPDGARRVWLACEPLDGAVVRQSEAIALGNAMVESFGGRIIEDRAGPEVMQQSFIEGKMTDRARARAQAMNAIDRVKLNPKTSLRANHHRLAMAEAFPGSVAGGMVFRPEGAPGPLYVVERRVNESWVQMVAKEPGAAGLVAEPLSWVSADATSSGPFGAAGEPHWGFTDTTHTAEPDDEPQPSADDSPREEDGGDPVES